MENIKSYEDKEVKYEIDYNGRKLVLSPHQLFNQPSFQRAVMIQLNESAPTVKAEEWSNKIQEMLDKGERYET